MKFSNVLLEYLIEQVNDDPNFGFNPPADDNNDVEDNGEDNGNGENNDEEDLENPDNQPVDDANRPLRPPETVGVKRRAKMKWAQEVPGLDLQTMDQAITWFDRNKSGLITLPTEGDLETDPAIRVMPEVYMLHVRFPDFPVFDLGRLRDILSYTWEQLQYLIDRFNATITQPATIVGEDKTEGSNEEKREYYFNRWRTQPTKIIDEGDFIAHKVECVAESINLGKFQHWINTKYDPNVANNWCITRPLDAGNLYGNYRSYRSYYFVYDGSKEENDNFYVSVLQPNKPNAVPTAPADYRYTITKRKNQNDDLTNLNWGQVVNIWPKLADKQHMFKFFGVTRKEDISAVLDVIQFKSTGDTGYDMARDFIHQDKDIKLAYVMDPNRKINSIRAFKSLNIKLQKAYITATTKDNFETRFITKDSSDPFAILKYITKTNLKTLDSVSGILQLKGGVKAIKNGIITSEYVESFGDYKYDNLRLYESKKRAGVFGILNLDTQMWALPVKYIKQTPQTYYKAGADESTNKFLVYPYSAEDGDAFYVIMPYRHLSQKTSSPSLFHKGRIFKKESIAAKLALLTKLGNN